MTATAPILPIRDEASYEAALAEVRRLWGSGQGTPDGDRLEVLTILVERRETLHSSRLFDHLRTSSEIMQNWMMTASSAIVSRGGYSAPHSQQVATKLLAEIGGREAATLAYADAFLLMALIGIITLCLVPIIPPTPVASKK